MLRVMGMEGFLGRGSSGTQVGKTPEVALFYRLTGIRDGKYSGR